MCNTQNFGFQDKANVVDALRRLHRNGHRFTALEIRDEAEANDRWSPAAVANLQEIASQVLEGHRFRLIAKPYWRRGILQRWRAEAKKGDRDRIRWPSPK